MGIEEEEDCKEKIDWDEEKERRRKGKEEKKRRV